MPGMPGVPGVRGRGVRVLLLAVVGLALTAGYRLPPHALHPAIGSRLAHRQEGLTQGQAQGQTQGQRGGPLCMGGYIPPELDPEYRNVLWQPRVAKAEELGDSGDAAYPLPKEGDVVLYEGRKWGDKQLGRIRLLRYVDAYSTFFCDVIPLKERGLGEVWVVDKQSRAEFLDVRDVTPVKAAFARNENGWKVYFTKKEAETEAEKAEKGEGQGKEKGAGLGDLSLVALRAPRYRIPDANYRTSGKTVDYTQIATDLQAYAELKKKITTNTLKIGAVITGALGLGVGVDRGVLQGLDVSACYLLGVFGGCLYFDLLATYIEGIGAGYAAVGEAGQGEKVGEGEGADAAAASISTPAPDLVAQVQDARGRVGKKLTDTAAKGRLLVPPLLLAVLAAKVRIFGSQDFTPSGFHLIPKEEYLSFMGGFLTIRLALYYYEVRKEFKLEDLLGIVPGSVSIVLRKLLEKDRQQKEEGVEVVQMEAVKKLVFVTGPAAAGRAQLLQRLLLLPGGGVGLGRAGEAWGGGSGHGAAAADV